MRISDWISYVCSSDLQVRGDGGAMTEIGHFTTFSNLSTLSSYAPLRLAKAAIFGSPSSECRYGPGPIDGTDAADPRVSPICKPSGARLPVRMPVCVTPPRSSAERRVGKGCVRTGRPWL